MKTEWQRPTGIIYKHRPKLGSPFLLCWEGDGRNHTQSFKTEAEREEAAKALADKRADYGREVLDFDPMEWRRWLAFKERVGGADLDAVAGRWDEAVGRSKVTVAAASITYQAQRATEGLAPDTVRQIRIKLSRFCEAFGARPMASIQPTDIRAWLADLEALRGFVGLTLRHHRKDVSTFFKWAKRERIVTTNPCDFVKPPSAVESDEITLLTLHEAKELFRLNRDQPCVGRLALEAFGGVRASFAGRLRASEIITKEKGVVFPKKLHKPGRRNYVDGFPPNLWAWVKRAPAECWEITPRQYAKLKHDCFIRASIEHKRNCLRHSFASYHVARGKDAAATAILLTHRNPSLLYQFYKGRATAKDGAAYFRILP